MEVTSLTFLLYAIIVIISFWLAPSSLRSSIILPAANCIFVWLAMPNWYAIAYLGFFFIITYMAIWLAYLRNTKILLSGLISILFVFAYLKSYQFLFFLPYINYMPVIVGLSYVLIRSLQVIIDIFEGTLSKPPNPWAFANFLYAWPMLLSGPIQNYQDFCYQVGMVGKAKFFEIDFEKAFSRIIWGVFSILVLSGLAHDFHNYFLEVMIGDHSVSLTELGLNEEFSISKMLHNGSFASVYLLKLLFLGSNILSPFLLAITAFFYLIYLYFNFAGYTEIAIGVGSLLGLKIPENFNKPWASRNFLDFWSRWHMTLANWFKTYVFNPQMRFLLSHWPNSTYVAYYAVIAFFTTFFLLGLWHGPTLEFFLCSLALGVGVSLNKLWQLKSRAILGKHYYTKLTSNFFYQLMCTSLALGYAAMSIIPFWTTFDGIVKMSLFYGVWGLFLSFLAASLLALPIATLAWFFLHTHLIEKKIILKPLYYGAMLAIITINVFLYPPYDVNFVYQAF